MGSTSSASELALDGDEFARGNGCFRGGLCCGKHSRQPLPVQKLDWDTRPAEDQLEQETLLAAPVESQRQATGRKAAMGGACCIALVAGACAVLLGLRFWPHQEVRAPTEAYVATSKQFAADVARGECDYAVPDAEEGLCFCQLAGNRHCSNQACACSSGCGGDVLVSAHTVTFANSGDVGECKEPTALLTAPKHYFEHITFLLQWCPKASRSLLVELMENGFNNYQEQVAIGPVKQCVHAAKKATVPWMHVHTFCSEGFLEGLQKTGENGWCGTITHVSEVPRMADELVAWALADGPLRSVSDFASCRSIGCGQDVPKPLCSCTKDCLDGENVTCCDDFSASCDF